MEEVVKDAISLGIKDICFTDHVDYGPYRDWDDPRGIKYRPGRRGRARAGCSYQCRLWKIFFNDRKTEGKI
ncbi:hypothetical protein NIA73_03220 [Anaerobutyricum hallii]|nr:hypothetical protein [Anaerobutyricum hallii]